MKDIPISMVMSTHLITLGVNDKIIKAKEFFEAYNIHHVLVAQGDSVMGILSKGDILYLEGMTRSSFDEFIRDKTFEKATVGSIMTQRPFCIESNLMMSDALDLMLNQRVNALPVNSNGKLVGILTSYDVMEYLKDELINNET